MFASVRLASPLYCKLVQSLPRHGERIQLILGALFFYRGYHIGILPPSNTTPAPRHGLNV